MRCNACAAEISDLSRFCSECGARLSRICADCRFENTPAAKFCGGCGQPLGEPDQPVAARSADMRIDAGASAREAAQLNAPDQKSSGALTAPSPERRQITVLFCDLVGSTELSGQVDPELLTDLYGIYRGLSEEAVLACSGHVAEYLGDGIVAYFGYPKALENAAELSIRAARRIIEGVSSIDPAVAGSSKALSVRVGIATGVVVAGQLLGTDADAQVRTVIGETPNIAARLQAIAEPNSIVISETTRQLVQHDFELLALAPVVLKGVNKPVTPYLVQNAIDDATYSASFIHEGALIGRKHELSLFLDRWHCAQDQEGQALLISGEAGIGKSRLVRAFRAEIAEDPHTWLELRGSRQFQNTAFQPVLDLVRRTFDIHDKIDPEEAKQRLTRSMGDIGWDPSESLPILFDLFSLSYDGEDATTDLSPEGRRRRTLVLLCDWVFKLTEDNPVVMAAEDLHWMDPSTRELLTMLVTQCPSWALMLVVTFRTEFLPDWHRFAHVSTLPLRPLRKREIIELVGAIVGDYALPRQVIEQISEKTDGVPLFVEEVIKSVLESGFLEPRGDHFERTDPLPALAIPSTLQDSLMARLDRLGDAKNLAQLASVTGREFSYELIRALSDLGQDQLEKQLADLVEARVVYQRGVPPRSVYLFKHALIQDIAYQALLRKKRQTYHERVALVLLEHFPDQVEREPEVLAGHLVEAGKVEEAVRYYHIAGDQARQRSAYEEQVAHFERGIEILKTLPESLQRDRLELSLQIALQIPLIAARGYAKQEVRVTCERARELSLKVGDTPDLGIAVYGLTTYYLNSSELETCLEVCDQLLAISELPENAIYRPAAYQQRGFVRYFRGELEQAYEDCRMSIECYDLETHSELGPALGQDPGPTAYALAGVVAWQRGFADQAVELVQQGMTMAEQIGDPFTLAMTQQFMLWVHVYRRDNVELLAAADTAIALAEMQGFQQWLHQARCLKAWGLLAESPADALHSYSAALSELNKVGAVVGRNFFTSLYAEILAANQDSETALKLLDRCLQASARKTNQYMDGWVLRTSAEILLDADPLDLQRPVELLRRSIAVARRQGSRLIELRSLNVLGRLNQASTQDLARLRELCTSLSEGRQTIDYQQAAALC